MSSEMSCLIVTGDSFPEKKLSERLAPAFTFSEFDYATSLSDAFQVLLNSNFNLCLIGTKYQDGLESFFRDMNKLGRDKTCAFVKVLPATTTGSNIKEASHPGFGFCASISPELIDSDIQALRAALSKEVVRMHEEQRVEDIPKYVDMVLKEIDKIARRQQRGIEANYDKVIARLVRDMMGPESIHRDAFIDKLAEEAELCESFNIATVDMPDLVLERKLPKLEKTKYVGRSSRVWNNLLKRHGAKEE